jgi:hypothetical protein
MGIEITVMEMDMKNLEMVSQKIRKMGLTRFKNLKMYGPLQLILKKRRKVNFYTISW